MCVRERIVFEYQHGQREYTPTEALSEQGRHGRGHACHKTSLRRNAADAGREQLDGSQDFRDEKGSSQGHNLALTGFPPPRSLDSGRSRRREGRRHCKATALQNNSCVKQLLCKTSAAHRDELTDSVAAKKSTRNRQSPSRFRAKREQLQKVCEL